MRFVVGKDNQVIDVASPKLWLQFFVEKPVQGVEVDVGEELGCLVPEGKTPAAFQRRKEVIAGEIVSHFLLGIGGADYGGGKPKCGQALDAAGEFFIEDLVVEGGEVLPNIQFQDPGKTVGSLAGHRQSLVGTHAFATRERMGGKGWFKDRFQDTGEGVVDHSVAKGGGGDVAWLGIENGERSVSAGLVCFGGQLALETDQFWFEVQEKCGHIGAFSLARSRGLRSPQEVGKAG